MVAPRWIATTLTGLLLLLAGCGGGGGNPAAPPSGWNATETRMWAPNVDTSVVFQDMSSLQAMGVLDEEMTLSTGSISQEQFQKAVKQSLAELYRSNPTVVDSLFEEHAVPVLQDAELGSDAVQDGEIKKKLLDKFRKKAFQAIQDHYEQPKIQEGITGLPYPDSLRTEENSGRVEVQVHVTRDGTVDAVEVVEGTHPVLDAIIMRAAATETTWNPAYVTEGQNQTPYPGWGRLSTNFPAPK
ncbi:MAG: energy transducer TonB [Salinibacter sp.]